MTFDLFKYLSYRSKAAPGVLGAPIESILSETIKIHPFCGNEEKETYLSHWFDEMCRKFKKIPWWNFKTLAFNWLRGNVRKIKKQLMKFWDTRFFLTARKRAENLKNTLMEFSDTRFSLAARKCAEKLKIPWWISERLTFHWLRGNLQKI